MKFYLSVVLAAMLVTGTVTAQHSAQKVNIGIKGGLNLYNINNENGFKYDVKPGFNIGLLGHIHLAPQMALQPEIVYSSQGAKSQGTDSKLNLDYINVPVLFQYMFDNGFRLQAGPQVGFLVSAKTKINDTKTDMKDSYKPVDLGLSAGIGYVHPPSGFGVDLRYNLGLTDINEISAVNSKSTNRGGQLGVFYLINHKK
ncbi:MAG: PorT family protein [Ferruginibacter sp.]|nr:PorT family protein [Ferruginibacter sp.]